MLVPGPPIDMMFSAVVTFSAFASASNLTKKFLGMPQNVPNSLSILAL
jgi:hypothetical protein